ncbi:hypothetical protein HK405_010428 [Cladochytrium tenue]|nr:hypothetical protein HK405_010428 [Cladochytrium tenue]
MFSWLRGSSRAPAAPVAADGSIDGLPVANLSPDSECAACDDPCAAGHPAFPKSLASKIDPSPLRGTMKPYSRQLLILAGSGPQWPERIEEAAHRGSLAHALVHAARAHPAHTDAATIITACDREPSPESESTASEDVSRCSVTEVILLPDFVAIRSLRPEQAPALMDAWASAPPASEALFVALRAAGLDAVPVPDDALVLVCSHARRDRRCGVAGPVLVQELRSVADDLASSPPSASPHPPRVAVHGVSHLGGHKFAGVVAVYPKLAAQPRGIWYGRINPCLARAVVLETALKGAVIPDHFRGASLSPEALAHARSGKGSW